MEFKVYCDSDPGGAHFLRVLIYFFKDCVEACASFGYY